jgi:P2-related tail formation protein
MTIPSQLDGIISYFDSYKPTDKDMVYLPHVVLTSVDKWDPYSNAFTKKEEVAHRCAVVAKEHSNRLQLRRKLNEKKGNSNLFILLIITLVHQWQYALDA